MYKISQLAERAAVSRTTLLYYEKLGIIQGARLSNGYRSYSEKDLQRLLLLQKLQAGGLTLSECHACLDAKINRSVLQQRLSQLDEEIAQKQKSRQLLAALLGESSLSEWHDSLEQLAPDAHLDWLIKQGFDEKQAMRLKWLSKDMNEHDRYMADFDHVFSALTCWGPGSEQDSLAALKLVPFAPQQILEIGCGQGNATKVLAQHSEAIITAVDNEEYALENLSSMMDKLGAKSRISTVCANMANLPFESHQFDLIWSEASAYIMGVENAFKQWRNLLTEHGYLVLSDLVWSTETPSPDLTAFWAKEYPDMTTSEQRILQAEQAGYQLVETFPISQQAWDNYYLPLASRVEQVTEELAGSAAIADLKRELDVYNQRNEQFQYQMFVFKNS